MDNRICYFIDETMCNDEGEWIPAVVEEYQSGYSQTNWTWKCTFEKAKEYIKDMNSKLGLTELDAWKIVASSMGASNELKDVQQTPLNKVPLHINSKSDDVQKTIKKRLGVEA